MPQWMLTEGTWTPCETPTALLSGYAAYTTFRLPISRKIFEAHCLRLQENAEALGLLWPYSCDLLYQQIQTLAPPQEPVIRLTAYPEVTTFGALLEQASFSCKLLLSTRSLPALSSAPLSLKTICYTPPCPSIKWVGIGETLRQKRLARQAGYDDILLINHRERITEASTANFFVISQDGVLCTPHPERDGCLPGITRQKVLMLADTLEIPCSSEPLNATDIPLYAGAFLTNAVQGLVPVGRIDEHPLSWPEKAQAIFQQLQAAPQQDL